MTQKILIHVFCRCYRCLRVCLSNNSYSLYIMSVVNISNLFIHLLINAQNTSSNHTFPTHAPNIDNIFISHNVLWTKRNKSLSKKKK